MTALQDFINAQKLDIKNPVHLKHWADLVWFGGGKPITVNPTDQKQITFKVPTLIERLMKTAETHNLSQASDEKTTNTGSSAAALLTDTDKSDNAKLDELKRVLEEARLAYLKTDKWYKPRSPALTTFYKTSFIPAAAPAPAATQTAAPKEAPNQTPQEPVNPTSPTPTS